MRCNQFDTYVDEMLSGILHPEAARHLRECERCSANYARRAALQANLRQLAATATAGPSAATDRAVLEAFRRRQHPTVQPPAAPVLHFPRRTAFAGRRGLWSAVAAAALLIASIASGVHLWRGTGVVTAPQRAAGPMSSPRGAAAVAPTERATVAGVVAQRRQPMRLERPVQMASMQAPSPASENQTRVSASQRQSYAYDGDNYESAAERAPAASPVLRLASTGSGNVARSASSTWQGYSNLMYCDPVTCAGPMQVVRIKVPVGQVKANLGQSTGDGYVNADVVVGPDGLARAIRMAD
jgi:hypothetical protein